MRFRIPFFFIALSLAGEKQQELDSVQVAQYFRERAAATSIRLEFITSLSPQQKQMMDESEKWAQMASETYGKLRDACTKFKSPGTLSEDRKTLALTCATKPEAPKP